MFKRILSLMIAVMMLASIMVVTASAADKTSVYGANVTAKAGETVKVSFNIANNTGYNAAKMTVSVAAPLEIVDITKGQMTGNVNVGKGIINHASDAVDGVVAGNGTLFTVTVKVAEDAVANTYPVNLNVSFLTLADASLDYSVAAGSVTIEGPAHDHDYKTLIDHEDSTCVKEGFNLWQCECGETSKEVLPLKDHTPGDWYKDHETHHWKPCTVCGEKCHYGEHVYDLPDTTNPYIKYCVCGRSINTYVPDVPVPPAGDMTTTVAFGTMAMIFVAAAAAYVASRKFAK